jgi:uncharacterized membrane protein YfcA
LPDRQLRTPRRILGGQANAEPLMIFGIPVSELSMLALAVIVAGAITGVLAGLFGIGGGAVIVPVLYEVFGVLGVSDDIRLQLCVGTSLAIIVPTNIRSFLAHRAKGAVRMEVVRQWFLPAIAGVGVGSLTAAFAPSVVLKIAFVIVAGTVSFKLIFGRDSWRIADKLPGLPLMACYGSLVGLASSLMGVSGGAVSTLVLTLYGMPIHNAVATSAAVGVPITIAGTIGYMLAGLEKQALTPPLSIGFVSLIAFALMAPIASYVAPDGARLAHALKRRTLEVAFGCMLLTVCVRFIISMI